MRLGEIAMGEPWSPATYASISAPRRTSSVIADALDDDFLDSVETLLAAALPAFLVGCGLGA